MPKLRQVGRTATQLSRSLTASVLCVYKMNSKFVSIFAILLAASQVRPSMRHLTAAVVTAMAAEAAMGVTAAVAAEGGVDLARASVTVTARASVTATAKLTARASVRATLSAMELETRATAKATAKGPQAKVTARGPQAARRWGPERLRGPARPAGTALRTEPERRRGPAPRREPAGPGTRRGLPSCRRPARRVEHARLLSLRESNHPCRRMQDVSICFCYGQPRSDAHSGSLGV